jgi:putative transposase
MRRLLTGYAVSYNRRHRRHGHLFQNRYKSILCQEDIYLLELVRYIHLNPLRAKIVKSPTEFEKYPYSGHSVLMGKVKREFQDTGYVLRLFLHEYKAYCQSKRLGFAMMRAQLKCRFRNMHKHIH